MDGGGGIDPTTNLPTLPGQGNYFWDASNNAIFYDSEGVPTNKSFIEFDGSGDYLSIPDSSDWDLTGDFTVECWFNLLRTSGDPEGFVRSGDNNWYAGYGSDAGNPKVLWVDDEGSVSGTTVLAIGEWYHFAVARSGTTVTVYVDGVAEGTRTTTGTISGTTLEIGKAYYLSDKWYYGYLDQVRVSDTARYTSTFTPPTTPFTTDANTKLLVQSDWSEGGLGADHSNNYNYFTPTNLVASDMMPDSPMNNFATLSPVWNSTGVTFPLSEGNLKCAMSTSGSGLNGSTIAPESGKWYCEYLVTTLPGSDRAGVGIADIDGLVMDNNGNSQNIVVICTAATNRYWDFGTEHNSATGVSQVVANDIVQFAWDVDTGKVWIGINNTWQGASSPNPATGTSPLATHATVKAWAPIIRFASGGSESFTVHFNAGQDSSFAGTKTAQGNMDANDRGDFYYAPPSGYLSVCNDNLSDPLIALPGEYFNTLIWTGDAASSRSITGVGFQPDLVWNKARSAAEEHDLTDSVRGADKQLHSNSTAAEGTRTDVVTGFDSDGFSIGSYTSVNGLGDLYVAWNWKAGGAAVSNSDGDITSSVSANTTAGFSIVSWTGSGTLDDTVGHGLSVTPSLFIFKARPGSDNWPVWHESFGIDSNMYLDTAGALYDGNQPDRFPALPTASVFTPGNAANIGGTGLAIITYCFHSVEGYSKVGSYTGNGNADGPFIYTGFEPAFVMIKGYSSGSSDGWFMMDNKRNTYNVQTQFLAANATSTETQLTTKDVDFLSNGFKLRQATGWFNSTYDNIYIAFAESPFKYSNAR